MPRSPAGASASSAAAVRSACWRSVKSAGEARDVPKSRPRAVSAAHRRRVTQPPQAAAPTTVNGLMRARTAVSVVPSSAHIASAKPIAQAVYSRRGKISRGTTRMHAPQRWHSYRRQSTLVMVGAASAVAGPRTWRSRVPSPWTTRLPPTGRAAAPHPRQRDGLAIDTDGIAASHALTPSELRQILSWLRTSSARSSTRRVSVQDQPSASPFLWVGTTPSSASDPRFYAIICARGTRRSP